MKSLQTITVNYCGNQHHCLIIIIVSIQHNEEIIYVHMIVNCNNNEFCITTAQKKRNKTISHFVTRNIFYIFSGKTL